METANCVSKAVEIFKRDGQVRLDAYWLTAMMLKTELNKLGFEYIVDSTDKWNHIFIATPPPHRTTSKLEEVIKC